MNTYLQKLFFKIKKAYPEAMKDPVDDGFDKDLKSLGQVISNQLLSLISLKKSILKHELE